MKMIFGISLVSSLAVCLIAFSMCMAGLGEPNLAASESLAMFYLTLFGCSFVSFPLAVVAIALISFVWKSLSESISKA